jgi:hypothetical protein
VIGEPLQDDGHGHDEAQAKPHTTDDAVAEIQQPQVTRGQAGQQGAEPVEGRRQESDTPRTEPGYRQAADGGAAPEQQDGQAVGQRDLFIGPPGGLAQWHSEHTPGVNRAQRELQDHCGSGYAPAFRFHDGRSLVPRQAGPGHQASAVGPRSEAGPASKTQRTRCCGPFRALIPPARCSLQNDRKLSPTVRLVPLD